MVKYHVAYGKRAGVPEAILSNKIPRGCIIFTEDTNEILFYDLEGTLKPYEERYKFNSLQEAKDWIKSYNCRGQILSVHEYDKCSVYIVNYKNELELLSGGLSEDTVVGHKGYYIESINTKEKWLILSTSTTKPDFPIIDDNIVEFSAPYAGVYKVTSSKNVTITNETGHRVSLSSSNPGYFYLVKGSNKINKTDDKALLSFQTLENNGIEYISRVDLSEENHASEHTNIVVSDIIRPGEARSFYVDITSKESSGIVYPYLNVKDNYYNTFKITSDTGYYAELLKDTDSWMTTCYADGIAGQDVEFLFLREGANVITIENTGTNDASIGYLRLSKLTDIIGKHENWDTEMRVSALKVVPSTVPAGTTLSYNSYIDYTTGYAVGDVFSLVNGAHYDFCGTISSIEGRKIYYSDNLPFDKLDPTTNDFDDHIFFVPSKPDTGIVQIVTIAFATGIGTKAPGKASFAAGRDTIAGGDYSFVGGRKTLAAYCAVALGYDVESEGRFSFSVCAYNKAVGEYSAVVNVGNVAGAEATFVHGLYNKAYTRGMAAGGRYNRTFKDKIIVYGNGDSDSNRRDAYTLDWGGNGWYAGVVKVGGTGPGDPDAKYLVTGDQVESIVNTSIANYLKSDGFKSVLTDIISNMDIPGGSDIPDGDEVEY